MLDASRPGGRIFCLVLAVGMAAFCARLCAGEGAPAAKPAARAASPSPQSGPTLTNVVDTVYTAEGTAAQGVLIITWPAFVTASGTAVAAGTLNVTLGTNGALNVELAANAGANPPGVYYTVVYQLGPGEVRTEYWLVPTSSPATLAQVRTMPGSGTAAPAASVQYVNSALASKANDNAVVHLAGTETVTGTKIFSIPPSVPTPVGTGDVTNKAYVDASIATVGAGNFLPTAGGTMTGSLTLSGNPTAPLQAAPKQYVDTTAAAKADLVTGLVPTHELGSGTATALNCLLGNGTWGSCASSANATEIQSVPVGTSAPSDGQVLTYSATSGQYAPATPSNGIGGVSLSPSANQNIVQPVNTETSTNNFNAIRYVTASDNWSQSGFSISGSTATVTLSPCPLGVDTSGAGMYYVYIAQGATTEVEQVTGGTCSSGGASGTIIFNPANSYSSATIGSASSGIQEAINDGCGITSTAANCRIVLPPTGATTNALKIYGTVFEHCSRCVVEGNGTLLYTYTRDRAWMLGFPTLNYVNVALKGVTFSAAIQVDGCLITNTGETGGTATITVTSGCGNLRTGDLANINFTDSPSFWGSHGPITVSGTTVTYSHGGTIASAASPGTIAIQNAAIEDNATNLGLMEAIDVNLAAGGRYNQFFVVNNDQSATIRNFNENSAPVECTANHCGSYVYSGGSTAAAPVIWIDKANISPQCGGNGVTVYANNSVHITDSVIEGFGMWGINTQTILGSFGGTQLDNLYWEEGGGPCTHPYNPGGGTVFSAAGIIFQGGQQLSITGGEGPAGAHVPQFSNTGSTQYNYYVVVNDATQGWHSFPLFAGYALTNGSGSITVQYPHVPGSAAGDTVTYDILRMQPSTNLSANSPSFPVTGACNGGSPTACGSIVTGKAQCPGLVCTFTDNASANTSNYSINVTSWDPVLPFWPAEIVIPGSGGQGFSTAPVISETEPSNMVSVIGNIYPQIFIRQCQGNPNVGGNFFGGVWEQCLAGRPSGNIGALLLQTGTASGVGNLKGILNFEGGSLTNIYPQHFLTLIDSNPYKTLATIGSRPPNDANDTFIGTDNQSAGTIPSNSQLAFGAPIAISNYIGNVGDNSSYLERLTAAQKIFNVPVKVNGNLTITGTCTGCGSGGVSGGTATQLALYAASGATVSGDSGLTDNGTTLSYTGSNGISATAGTFSGNVTVNGQLLVAGPWSVSSPIPGSPMAPASAGTSALGISNDGNFYISANAGTPQKVATTATSSYFTNLFQEDANDLGEYNGTTAQGLNIYGTRADASDYERLVLTYDTVNTSYFKLDAQATGTGSHRGIAFWVNGAARWGIDQTDVLKPFVDNAYDLGSSTLHVRNGYFGTGVITPSLTLSGTALSSVIGTPSASLMTAGTVSGTGAPLCTDGTGNLTITTVGCPPGTGTLGGSGTTPQFAYWTNTNGLGAAPLYVSSANTVEQMNSTNVQTLNLYGTFTSTTNYERLSAAYVPGDTYFELQTQQGSGGGSQRGICFGVNNSCKWAVDTTTAFKPFNDNTRDIGTSTLRVRDFYLGRNLIMSGTATTYNGKATQGTGLAPIYGTVSSAGLTASVGSTALCSSSICGAGQYIVNYYMDSAASCTTAGSAAASLTIGWTDETSAKTLQVPLSGSGVSSGNSLALGNTANFASGDISLWSAGSANITYSTSYTGCTSGTGTYGLRLSVRQVQ